MHRDFGYGMLHFPVRDGDQHRRMVVAPIFKFTTVRGVGFGKEPIRLSIFHQRYLLGRTNEGVGGVCDDMYLLAWRRH